MKTPISNDVRILYSSRSSRATFLTLNVGYLLRDAQLKISVLKDDVDGEPLENGWGSFGESQLVGQGKVTNDKCGTWMTYKRGCIRADLHDKITLDGVNYKNKVYFERFKHSCDKPSCPVCYKKGWAVREAGKIENRLAELSKRFGQVEHVVCSVPSKDYGLSYEALREKVVKILNGLGVGGCMIWHAGRYNLRKHWYFSPHFHVLGFVLGGYGKCRRCKGGDCYACNGFEGKCYQLYRENGYIVRVAGERKTVGGTAWYQLNHAAIDVTKKRFHVVTWFGFCSYRKAKITVERRKRVCPICQHDLEKLRYVGNNPDVLSNCCSVIMNNGKRGFIADFEEDGLVAWVVDESKGWE